MARTVFVNPSAYRPKKRRARRSKRRNASLAFAPKANPRKRRRHRAKRRNAGIAPFVSNPLIMSNPRRRAKRRHSNPLMALNAKTVISRGLTYGGGAAIAVGANALLLNKVQNFWMRNGARFGGGVIAAAFLKGDLGAATAGAMFYPMFQEFAAKLLGAKAVTGTEADMDVLAADLEDVMDDLSADDLEDDEFSADLNLSDDLDHILS